MASDLEKTLSSLPLLESNDKTALTPEQQQTLDKHKVEMRLENERYMRDHPEISVMLDSFVRKVLLDRPTDIKSYAAGFFTDPGLKEAIETKLKQQ